MSRRRHILVIEGRFYDDISDELLAGAQGALKRRNASWEVATVPGALEIPQVLKAAIARGLFGGDRRGGLFDGCVALGCVIRGETSHYDIVANESAHALLQLAIKHDIPVGNGILTVENHAQAIARASPAGRDKGAAAVNACLDLIEIGQGFSRENEWWRRRLRLAAAMMRNRSKSF
jgi:6,7-dimethyl-8-ribityllumazine synthase